MSSANLNLVRSVYPAWGRGQVKTVRPSHDKRPRSARGATAKSPSSYQSGRGSLPPWHTAIPAEFGFAAG